MCWKRAAFRGPRHAVGQVAGMLVLAAAGSKTVTQDHPLFATRARRSNASPTESAPCVQRLCRASSSPSDRGGRCIVSRSKRAQEDLHLHGIDRARVDPVLEPFEDRLIATWLGCGRRCRDSSC